jgi:hypothetical protein
LDHLLRTLLWSDQNVADGERYLCGFFLAVAGNSGVKGIRASEGYAVASGGDANAAGCLLHALPELFLLQLEHVQAELFIIPLRRPNRQSGGAITVSCSVGSNEPSPRAGQIPPGDRHEPAGGIHWDCLRPWVDSQDPLDVEMASRVAHGSRDLRGAAVLKLESEDRATDGAHQVQFGTALDRIVEAILVAQARFVDQVFKAEALPGEPHSRGDQDLLSSLQTEKRMPNPGVAEIELGGFSHPLGNVRLERRDHPREIRALQHIQGPLCGLEIDSGLLAEKGNVYRRAVMARQQEQQAPASIVWEVSERRETANVEVK